VTVPVAPSRGPRPDGRLSADQRLLVLAWAQLALTACCVVIGLLAVRVLVDVGAAMACFDGDRQACVQRPVGLLDQWRSLAAGGVLLGTAAAAVFVADRHRHARSRRRTAITMLGASATLDGIATAVALTL
jgi:hypothetical protein